MKRLAIITTHPIQYNAPLFAMLANRGNTEIKVFYTWGKEVLQNKYDPGFGKKVEWDIPLLEGYEYEFVNNIAKDKGSHHFNGIDNPGLIKAIKDWGANAVLVFGWSFKSHLKAMRYFKGKIPVLFRGDSTLLQQQGKIKKTFRKIFLTWVYKHIDTALYVGTHNKAYFIEYGLKEKQLVFAPHAIDNARFQQDIKAYEELAFEKRKTFNIKPEEIVFLYAGKLDKNKNIAFLATAFLEADMAHTHLVIAGNGPEEEGLKSGLGKEKNIHFLPFQNQSQMPALYRMADVFVLPSIAETWGLSLNEAMACGRALLASDGCAGAIDLIESGANGYIFEKNKMENAVEKIKLLSKSKEQLFSFGQASYRLIANWSFKTICDIIESKLNKEF